MKKIISLFTVILLIVAVVQAQPCKCNRNGFNPFKYTYAGANLAVSNGHQFEVKCKTTFKLEGGYKCAYTTAICDVQFKATIKNAAGVVIKNDDAFQFPFNYEFETAGNYVLEIAPWCGGKKCTPAKFYFTVTCDAPATCACNDKNGWDKFTAYIDGTVKPTVCGSTFTLKKEQPIVIQGGYKCLGNCNVVINGTLTNTTTGSLKEFPNMKFEGEFKFTEAGKYKLVAVPTCNGKDCKPCIFYFNIN